MKIEMKYHLEKLLKTLGSMMVLQEVTITYNYYANVLDAGSSYLDQKQLYVNPVNCCMYVIGRENEKYSLELDTKRLPNCLWYQRQE